MLPGWSPWFERAFAPFAIAGLAPARVTEEHDLTCWLLTAEGEVEGRVSGRLLHEAANRSELPAVGDWVAIQPPIGGIASIQAVLPRRSAFLRKSAGKVTAPQMVAANVDTVFLMTGLDGDFSLRRMERCLVLARESRAEPVILLNKADLCAEGAERVAQMREIAPEVHIAAVSALTGAGLEAIAAFLPQGATVALLGSSGAGKSTLVNRLLGEERQRVREVRADDSRGRHTTTTRELIRLPSGAWLIDTPGMRELQLWASVESLDNTFADVDGLAAVCRFSDCAHGEEPGCAVRAAIETGALDTARWESYEKLRRELRQLHLRQDQRAAHAEKQRIKRIHREFNRSHRHR